MFQTVPQAPLPWYNTWFQIRPFLEANLALNGNLDSFSTWQLSVNKGELGVVHGCHEMACSYLTCNGPHQHEQDRRDGGTQISIKQECELMMALQCGIFCESIHVSVNKKLSLSLPVTDGSRGRGLFT